MIWHVKSSETVLAVSANQRAAALAIAVDGMWGKTTVNVTCSANSAYTSAETVNFVSWCVDGEIKLKQNTDGVGRSETKQNFVSVLFHM
jgi:hypothetical protein